MEEEKLFTADYTKRRATIIIDVFENGNSMSVVVEPKCTMGYQELIGIIEVCKLDIVRRQGEKNREDAANQKTDNSEVMKKQLKGFKKNKK